MHLEQTPKYHRFPVSVISLKINGEYFILWKMVDSGGHELDIFLQKLRNKKSATRFLTRLLGCYPSPRVAVTGKLRSYRKPIASMCSNTEHRSHKGLNTRAENAHQPVLLHLLLWCIDGVIMIRKIIKMPFHIASKLLKHFKGFCSSTEVIMLFVYMKCRFTLRYRELGEMVCIRGAAIDHSTLQRKHRDKVAAKTFFCKTFKNNDCPDKVNIDKSGSNISALNSAKDNLSKNQKIEIRQNKYLNNIIEQDYRLIKKRTKPTLGFKNFQSVKIDVTEPACEYIIEKENFYA